ncbi:Uncharacterized protein GBIM_15070 [Gryllus bimaculatus]|nr:Uncharacterized protein GBIM_15070 [Gryllus bimaculatus]
MANHVRDGGSRDLGPSRLLATPAGAFLKWPETRGPALVAHAHADLHFELGSTKETPGLAARQRKSFLVTAQFLAAISGLCIQSSHLWAHACHVKLGRKRIPIPRQQQFARILITSAWNMEDSTHSDRNERSHLEM